MADLDVPHDPSEPAGPIAARVYVLFVCLGNICRSPMAEGVFRAAVAEAGLERAIHIDSAGLGAWHEGEPPDARAQAAASRRGYDLSQQRAREIRAVDLDQFDFVLVMDDDNLKRLEALGDGRAEVRLLLEFATAATAREVPDPYYGDGDGFERALDLIEDATRGLLQHIRETRL